MHGAALVTTFLFCPFRSAYTLQWPLEHLLENTVCDILGLSTWKPSHQLGHLAIHLSQRCHTPLGLGNRVDTWSHYRASTALQGLPSLTTGTSVPRDLSQKGPAEQHSTALTRQLQRQQKQAYVSMQSQSGFNCHVVIKTFGLIWQQRCSRNNFMTQCQFLLDILYQGKKRNVLAPFPGLSLKERAQWETDSRPHSWSRHHRAKGRKGQSHHMPSNRSHITDVPPKTQIRCTNKKKLLFVVETQYECVSGILAMVPSGLHIVMCYKSSMKW